MSLYLAGIIATVQQLRDWIYGARKKNNVDWMCLVGFSINTPWIWDCEVKPGGSRGAMSEIDIKNKKTIKKEVAKVSPSSLYARMRRRIPEKSCANERYDIWCLLWATKMRKLEEHIVCWGLRLGRQRQRPTVASKANTFWILGVVSLNQCSTFIAPARTTRGPQLSVESRPHH